MSGRIERLVGCYERFCRLPWERSLSGPQRVWFAIYDKEEERRLRTRLTEFEVATRRAGHGWRHLDVTDFFGHWMGRQEYRESYFESPDDLDLALPDFERWVISSILEELEHPETDRDTVVAVSGIAALFGFSKASTVIGTVADFIPGRLLVFFPGDHENNNYRLLDARDGWNYMAVPITADCGADA